MPEVNLKTYDEHTKSVYTAFFDDSGEPSDVGQRYSVIATLLIRRDLYGNVDAEMRKVWDRYLPGIDMTEFHARDIEEARRPFSLLGDDSRVEMQKEFIKIIGLLDLPTLAITVDNENIKANEIFGPRLAGFDSKVLGTSLVVAFIVGLFIDVARGERCNLVADEGLIHRKHKRTLEKAIELLQTWGGAEISSIIKQFGFASPNALRAFLVEAKMPEKASHKSVGIQLADHVARYVFKYAKVPTEPDPRYLALLNAGLKHVLLTKIPEAARALFGLDIHVRLRLGAQTASRDLGKEVAPSDLEKVIPEMEKLLKSKLGKCLSCPKCNAKLFWGCPTQEVLDLANRGELLLCGEIIREKNYCPQCGTLVVTAADILRQWSEMV